MSDYEIHIGDVGTLMKVNVTEAGAVFATPLAQAEELKIKIERKDRTSFAVDADIYQDDDTGRIISCLSDANFFTLKGRYKIQGFIKLDDTHIWHTAQDTFMVSENIQVVTP